MAGTMMTTSVVYHATLSHFAEGIDTAFAVVFMVMNVDLLTEKTFSKRTLSIRFKSGFGTSLCVALFSLIFYGLSRVYDNSSTLVEYSIVHSIWHLMSVVVGTTVFAYHLGYVTEKQTLTVVK